MVIYENQSYYRITEACKIAGISRVSLLRWIREGKCADVKTRDRNGWRLFTEEEVAQLKSQVESKKMQFV